MMAETIGAVTATADVNDDEAMVGSPDATENQVDPGGRIDLRCNGCVCTESVVLGVRTRETWGVVRTVPFV